MSGPLVGTLPDGREVEHIHAEFFDIGPDRLYLTEHVMLDGTISSHIVSIPFDQIGDTPWADDVRALAAAMYRDP